MHGVKLATVVEELVAHYGWEELAYRVNLNCFKNNPTVKSSLKFLRRTQWARDKVERLYLDFKADKKSSRVVKRPKPVFTRADGKKVI